MLKPIATAAALGLAAAAPAQTTTAPARTGALGGLGSLLGGAGGIPSVAGVGASNAAGLLGYCIKNNLLGSVAGQTSALTGVPAATATPVPATGAQGILQRLTGRQGVTQSPAYQAGQQGQVQTGVGPALSLDSLRGQLKTRVCSAVLNRARSFL